jgi:hypothetical protein
MARYEMSDGMIVDTANASQTWLEETDWDGNNHISRATGSQWDHQRLYRSRRGRYYIVSFSQWQGSMPSAEWISNEEAARWLLKMGHDLPDDLKEVADDLLD